MNIPVESQIIIVGIEYYSLILGTLLAKSGINVLLVDKDSSVKYTSEEYISQNYSLDLLQEAGFIIADHQISVTDINKQALKLLANALCSVLWDVIVTDVNDKNKLLVNLNDGSQVITHQTDFILDSNELLFQQGNADDIIKNIAFLYWKIKSFLSGLSEEMLIKTHYQEKQIINKNIIDRLPKGIFENFKNKFFKPQDGFHLKESKINLHLSQYRGIEAGNLLPDLKVFDEKQKKYTSLYEWCKLDKFTIVMIGDLSSFNLIRIAKWLKTNYPVQLFYLPHTQNNQQIFDFFNIIEGEKKTLIIRPDRYIGFINDRIDLDIIDNYLSDFLLMKPQRFLLKSFNQLDTGIIENQP